MFKTLIFRSLLLIIVSTSLSVNAQGELPVSVQTADYPKIVELDGGTVTIHHPQIESWNDFEILTGWIAIEVLEKGSENAWIGSVLVDAETDIDWDERLVVMHDAVISARKFPGGDPGDAVRELVKSATTKGPRSILLDVLLRALPESFEIPAQSRQTPEINLEPPRIVVSNTPLQLMFINGEPVAAPIEDTKLEFLVNTNWDVFHDTKKDRWYVLNNGSWQVSNYLASGDWENTTRLPRDMKKLPENGNWTEVNAALPAKKPDQDPVPFLVTMEPTELILIEGEPDLLAIAGTSVKYLSNTQSDLFKLDGRFFYLASGRWFSSPSLEGDWTAVSDLPGDMANIPPEHEKGHVLASVPGTPDARAALIEASIPRKASISRNAGADIEVIYSGEPQFVGIEGTELQRAANTASQVISINGYYYLCYNAVWYFAIKADGPWSVATNIPVEIYAIPATDPAHNVTYVFIDDDDDDEYVHYHYTSGYTGTFAFTWAVVWGTGWYYNPWYYYQPWGYPSYWHYPHSYGYGAWYNPATGRYGERAVGYGPYGGVASSAVYNPRTGAYARGASVWDSNEVARSGYAYNPRTDTFAAGNMYYDFDDREGWREGYVERGDRWAHGETQLNNGTARTRIETGAGGEAAIRRQDGNTSFAGRGSEGDLYAGRNGDVYKRGDEGWQKREDGGWSTMDKINRDSGIDRSNINRDTLQSRAGQIDRNRSSTQSLNRQFNARQSGQRNFGNFQQQRSMPRGGGRRR